MTELYTYERTDVDAATHIAGEGWHGIGTQLPEDADLEALCERVPLDYPIEKRPTFIEAPDGAMVKTGTFELYRPDTGACFGPASHGWAPVPNMTFLAGVEEFRKRGDLQYVAAGTFQGGKYAWVLVKAQRQHALFDGAESVSPYWAFVNPHRSGMAVQLRPQATVASCLNQVEPLFGNWRASQKSNRFQHVGTRQFSEAQCVAILDVSLGAVDKFAVSAERLGAVKARPEKVEEYWSKVFDITPANYRDLDTDARARAAVHRERRLDGLRRLLDTQPNADVRAGSWWQAFQATTCAVDHRETKNVDGRNRAAWLGNGRDRKIKALNLALEYADAA